MGTNSLAADLEQLALSGHVQFLNEMTAINFSRSNMSLPSKTLLHFHFAAEFPQGER